MLIKELWAANVLLRSLRRAFVHLYVINNARRGKGPGHHALTNQIMLRKQEYRTLADKIIFGTQLRNTGPSHILQDVWPLATLCLALLEVLVYWLQVGKQYHTAKLLLYKEYLHFN